MRSNVLLLLLFEEEKNNTNVVNKCDYLSYYIYLFSFIKNHFKSSIQQLFLIIINNKIYYNFFL